ncbi:type II toxin-antitoxin system HicA family toxin [Microcystis aeruginosa]|nr:type II toxin-antitoxin system HicA family toxin [Microcystis aeruginosa]
MIRRGGKHDIYHNPDTGKTEPIPRHREINERLAKKIIKSLTGDR